MPWLDQRSIGLRSFTETADCLDDFETSSWKKVGIVVSIYYSVPFFRWNWKGLMSSSQPGIWVRLLLHPYGWKTDSNTVPCDDWFNVCPKSVNTSTCTAMTVTLLFWRHTFNNLFLVALFYKHTFIARNCNLLTLYQTCWKESFMAAIWHIRQCHILKYW